MEVSILLRWIQKLYSHNYSLIMKIIYVWGNDFSILISPLLDIKCPENHCKMQEYSVICNINPDAFSSSISECCVALLEAK